MIVNFRVLEINQGSCKLVRIPMLIKKNIHLFYNQIYSCNFIYFPCVILIHKSTMILI
jgi:hypothetical protein